MNWGTLLLWCAWETESKEVRAGRNLDIIPSPLRAETSPWPREVK